MRHFSQTEKNARHRAKSREIGGKSSAPKRSLDFERPDASDPAAWLLAYLPKAYPLAFGSVHYEVIAAVTYAIQHGGNVVIAAPRGTGKSTLVNGLLLWALLTERTPFPVVIPWDDRAKRRALRFWANELCFNGRLARDYDDATRPFVEAKGIANRLVALTQGNEATGARLGITEGVIVLPNGLGAIGSATINGNPRGLNYSTIDGRVVRPSLVLIDDPQDRKTAKSKTRVQDTIERIDADVAGMAGPDVRMPIVMSCTVTEPDDVAEHYLTHPDWRAVRCSQIVTWPAGWDNKHGEARAAWAEWNIVRQDGDADKDGGASAVAHYLAHKDEMTAGMTVSWAERYDRKRGHPDALYAAILDYHALGEAAFMAERQNQPLVQGVTVYTLTPEVIVSRATDRSAGVVPEWSRLRVAATDINPSYGLTWGVVAFSGDQTSAVLAYGVHDMSVPAGATEAETARAIYETLVTHGRSLAAMKCKPEVWVIDAGGAAFDVVLRFALESVRLCGIQASPATGRGARNYRPFGKSVLGKPREQCHLATDARGRKWIAWNADYWREQAQRAWTGSIGAPGSCSLPAGHHGDFADQICREQLAGKSEIGGAMVWVWNTAPGRHDYCDVMSMAYMGAAWNGIGTGGAVVQPKRYVEARKCKVPMEGV